MNEKLFNIDYLKHLCQKFSLSPSKDYGQNYLINPEVIEEIIGVAKVTQKGYNSRSGSGFGILTLDLAAKFQKNYWLLKLKKIGKCIGKKSARVWPQPADNFGKII